MAIPAPGAAPGPPSRRLDVVMHHADGALGAWTHAEARPPGLAGIVEFMWHFDGVTAFRRERTFPNGLLEIIVHLGEKYRDVHGEQISTCPDACVTGIQLGPVIVEAPACRTTVMGIRLTVAGAYAMFGGSLHEIAGLTVGLDDLTGRAAAELRDRIGEADGPHERFARAADWIDGRLRRGIRADPAVAWAVAEIRRHAGVTSIARVRERAGLSISRMAAAFRDQVGVTPKQYARVIRFRHALARLHAGGASPADIAVAAGYYDQPHMTAEFKALSGLTPGEYLHARRYPNSPSVAE